MLRFPAAFPLVLIHLLLFSPVSPVKKNTSIIQNVDVNGTKPTGIFQDMTRAVHDFIDYVDDQFPIFSFLTEIARENVKLFTTGLDTHNLSWTINDFFLMPKTKWCGYGNRADNVNDLGEAEDVDSCCRYHDLCFEQIVPRQSKYNLTNSGLFTRSHCDCDEEFYKCLKKSWKNWETAKSIGHTYFNLLKPQCFRKDYPIMWCRKYADRGSCLEYKKDRKEQKIYQWFDNPAF